MKAVARRDAVFLASLVTGVLTLVAGVLRNEVSLITVGSGMITGGALPLGREAADDYDEHDHGHDHDHGEEDEHHDSSDPQSGTTAENN